MNAPEDNIIIFPNRAPFIMLPVLVDDMGLSPLALRLYIRLVTRAVSGGW